MFLFFSQVACVKIAQGAMENLFIRVMLLKMTHHRQKLLVFQPAQSTFKVFLTSVFVHVAIESFVCIKLLAAFGARDVFLPRNESVMIVDVILQVQLVIQNFAADFARKADVLLVSSDMGVASIVIQCRETAESAFVKRTRFRVNALHVRSNALLILCGIAAVFARELFFDLVFQTGVNPNMLNQHLTGSAFVTASGAFVGPRAVSWHVSHQQFYLVALKGAESACKFFLYAPDHRLPLLFSDFFDGLVVIFSSRRRSGNNDFLSIVIAIVSRLLFRRFGLLRGRFGGDERRDGLVI